MAGCAKTVVRGGRRCAGPRHKRTCGREIAAGRGPSLDRDGAHGGVRRRGQDMSGALAHEKSLRTSDASRRLRAQEKRDGIGTPTAADRQMPLAQRVGQRVSLSSPDAHAAYFTLRTTTPGRVGDFLPAAGPSREVALHAGIRAVTVARQRRNCTGLPLRRRRFRSAERQPPRHDSAALQST